MVDMKKEASPIKMAFFAFLILFAFSAFSSAQAATPTFYKLDSAAEANRFPMANQALTWSFTAVEFSASVAESASALNLGNTINFTVTVVGGTAPFNYAWYIDDQLVENSTSPYYSTNTQSVGPHHIYVIVTDAGGNTTQTLSPEFNVLSGSSAQPSSSSNPTQEPTLTPVETSDNNPVQDYTLPIALAVIALIVVVALAIFFTKRRTS